MIIDRFSDGDGWETPFTSGYDMLWEKIVEDMDKYPHEYQSWEMALFDSDDGLSDIERALKQKALQGYIEEWISSRLHFDTD